MDTWRRTFYSCMVAQLLAIAGFAFIFPFLPFYVRSMGVHSEAAVTRWTGILFSATGFTMAFVAPFWGMIADRKGRKLMVLRAMYGGAVVLFLMGLATNVHHLLILRILQGILTGTISASVALVASVVPEGQAGYALGMMQSMVFIGNFLGPSVGGVLANFAGPRIACMAGGVALFAGGLFVSFGATENFVPPVLKKEKGTHAFSSLFANRRFLTALSVLFLLQLCTSFPRPGMPQFVERMLPSRMDAELMVGLMVATNAVTSAMSAHVLGRYADIWGSRTMIVGCAILAGLVMVPMAFVFAVGQLFFLSNLYDGIACGISPAANSLIRRVTPKENLGKAFGVTQSINSMGFAIGPLIGGFVGASYGVNVPFAIAGVLLVLFGIAASKMLKRTDDDMPKPSLATETPAE